VAPPGDINENCLVHLIEQSLLKKIAENDIKINRRTVIQYFFELCPPRAGRPSVTYKKTPIFAPTAGARSSISPKLCMLIENVVTILKGGNYFSIQRIVFPAGAKMLSFGH